MFENTNSFNGAYCLNNIGFAWHKLGEYTKALDFHRDALAIVNRTVPEIHWSLANTLQNMGVLYHRIGDFQHAEEQFKLALYIYERAFDHDHPNIARTRIMLQCASQGSPLPS